MKRVIIVTLMAILTCFLVSTASAAPHARRAAMPRRTASTLFTASNTVYLPLILATSSGALPMPGANMRCAQRDSVEMCASISHATPAQNTDVTVYGRLRLAGVPQSGQPMQTTWHFKSVTQVCNDSVTGADGVASCLRQIGRATVGYEVVVDVHIAGYTTQTSFIPAEIP